MKSIREKDLHRSHANEDELKKTMGDKYHICHACSVYNTPILRLFCGGNRDEPIRVSDYEVD